MSGDDNKRAVAEFVERCQNQHDLAFADEAFHPKLVNHYRREGQALPETVRPASGFQAFYGALLRGFPDGTVEINEQLAERDLVATRKTFRGTHLGELWDLPPTAPSPAEPAGYWSRPARGWLVQSGLEIRIGNLARRRGTGPRVRNAPGCSAGWSSGSGRSCTRRR